MDHLFWFGFYVGLAVGLAIIAVLVASLLIFAFREETKQRTHEVKVQEQLKNIERNVGVIVKRFNHVLAGTAPEEV